MGSGGGSANESTGVHLVVAVSLIASVALAVTFFVGVWVLHRRGLSRPMAGAIATVAAVADWAIAVVAGRAAFGVTSGDAVVHHVYVFAVVGLPLVGVGIAVHLLWRRPTDPIRARIGWFAVGTFLLPALVGTWATYVEPERLRVDRVDLEPGSTAGPAVRIGVLADIQTDHFGDYERRAVDAMLAENPDIILVAGDITQLDWDDYLLIKSDGVEVLSVLDAPSGVLSIQGNTDPGPLEFASFSSDAGMASLLDEVVELEVKGRRLRIGGLAWPNLGRVEAAGFVREFAATATPDTFDLLLSHSPDGVLNLEDASAIDLVVTGHTHGGQFSLPLWGPIWNNTQLPRRVAGGGLHDVRGAPVYVSTGVGLQRGDAPKVRFLTRPSIGVITIP
jgi:predicted MPP superfamily phosphohydrolase